MAAASNRSAPAQRDSAVPAIPYMPRPNFDWEIARVSYQQRGKDDMNLLNIIDAIDAMGNKPYFRTSIKRPSTQTIFVFARSDTIHAFRNYKAKCKVQRMVKPRDEQNRFTFFLPLAKLREYEEIDAKDIEECLKEILDTLVEWDFISDDDYNISIFLTPHKGWFGFINLSRSLDKFQCTLVYSWLRCHCWNVLFNDTNIPIQVTYGKEEGKKQDEKK
jgi:hypothetical protein